MLESSVPAKFPIPWGNSAGGSYIRTIPTPSQQSVQAGAASLTDGFPPICFNPGAGVSFFGQDLNGILNEITKWVQWLSAGGPIQWDSSYAASIGGYPSGAIVTSATTPGQFWLCTADNNSNNPDSGGANWQSILGIGSVQSASLVSNALSLGMPMINGQIVTSVSSNALTITVQTLAGANPSSTSPVWFVFRSATSGLGTPVVAKVTSALSITIPAFSTMGFTTSTPSKLWLAATLNSGTVALAVINCLSGTSIFTLQGWNIAASISATSGGASTAQTWYATSAASSLPYSVLASLSWEGTALGTAGNWVVPTRIALRPDSPLPGTVVQVQNFFTTSNTTTGNSSFTATAVTNSITPTSSTSLVKATTLGTLNTTSPGPQCGATLRLVRGSTVLVPSEVIVNQGPSSGVTLNSTIFRVIYDAPQSSSSVTYTEQLSDTPGGGGGNAASFPTTGGGSLTLEEIVT